MLLSQAWLKVVNFTFSGQTAFVPEIRSLANLNPDTEAHLSATEQYKKLGCLAKKPASFYRVLQGN